MNETRKEELKNIHDTLFTLFRRLYSIQDEEGEAYENVPEPLQASRKAMRIANAEDFLDRATDCLMEVLSFIESTIED